MEATKIIIKPLMSEKSYADIANKKYWFVVDKAATKTQIKDAVESMFGVSVTLKKDSKPIAFFESLS